MKTEKSVSQIIAAHVLTYFNFLNLVLFVLILISGQYKNMLFMGVVVSNALIGIVQELRVKKLIDRLTVLTATKAKRLDLTDETKKTISGAVIAEGESFRLDSLDEKIDEDIKNAPYSELKIEDLQVGDVIRLSAGDQIVCDSVVLVSEGLEVDESMLTGESVPVHKKAGDVIFSGTHIVAGGTVCYVVHTGEDNYAAGLVRKAKTKKRASSEMQDAINKIIHYVSFAIIPIGITLFSIQFFRVKVGMSDALVNTVAGVLGMIPEGLVLLTSVSFIIGVGRLAGKRALVQEMEAIEALARVDTLCLDKTGTITTGALRVEKLVRIREKYTDATDNDITSKTDGGTKDHMVTLMEGIAYAFSETNVTGEALKEFFEDTKPYEITESLPFNSRRKYMGVSFAGEGTYVLGAPDFLTKEEAIIRESEGYAKKGHRVLLLAKTDALADDPSELTGTEPIGLVVMSDCVKEDAPETLKFFRDMGVHIKILSGDNPATVAAVAAEAGLENASYYVDATTLPADEDELRKVASKYTVFGRVSPEMKYHLIRAFQFSEKPDDADKQKNKAKKKDQSSVVGMVGDGVNDVLALKEADCSIAMANGADAARQTAHIVLTDSNFASMKDIVREGRTIIANIERVSALYLTKTIYSMILCVLFIIIGGSYPFKPIQLSLIGATAIGIPSFLLALEQHEEPVISGFLKHVFRISLPGAIGMTLVTAAVRVLDLMLKLGPEITSTMNMYLGGAVSLCVLVFVCKPMNKVRFAMCVGLVGIFLGACLILPGFFGILPVFR